MVRLSPMWWMRMCVITGSLLWWATSVIAMLSFSRVEWNFRHFGPVGFLEGWLWEAIKLFVINVVFASKLSVECVSSVFNLLHHMRNNTLEAIAILDVFL